MKSLCRLEGLDWYEYFVIGLAYRQRAAIWFYRGSVEDRYHCIDQKSAVLTNIVYQSTRDKIHVFVRS